MHGKSKKKKDEWDFRVKMIKTYYLFRSRVGKMITCGPNVSNCLLFFFFPFLMAWVLNGYIWSGYVRTDIISSILPCDTQSLEHLLPWPFKKKSGDSWFRWYVSGFWIKIFG